MKDGQQIIWEPGGTETTTPAGTGRRYRKPLNKLCALDLRILLADTYEEWYKHKAPRLSAALAFYGSLAGASAHCGNRGGRILLWAAGGTGRDCLADRRSGRTYIGGRN